MRKPNPLAASKIPKDLIDRTLGVPILGGNSGSFESVGTLSVIQYNDAIFLATAHHVIRKWKHLPLQSPLYKDWVTADLSKLKWLSPRDEKTDDDPDGQSDLAYTLLDKSAHHLINPELPLKIERASQLHQPYSVLITGYPSNRNHSHAVKNRKYAKAYYLEVEGDTDSAVGRQLKYRWCRDETVRLVDYEKQLFQHTGPAILPRGLSGGPVIYLNSHGGKSPIPEYSLIGIYTEYREDEKFCVATSSDNLLKHFDSLLAAIDAFSDID